MLGARVRIAILRIDASDDCTVSNDLIEAFGRYSAQRLLGIVVRIESDRADRVGCPKGSDRSNALCFRFVCTERIKCRQGFV